MAKRGRPANFDAMINSVDSARSREQEEIEDKIKGQKIEKGNDTGSIEGRKRQTTVMFSLKNFTVLRMYATSVQKSVSEVLNDWVEEKCLPLLQVLGDVEEARDEIKKKGG